MSGYKRLTKRGGIVKIEDFKEEYGYSSIYQRLSEIEDKIESGELVELPKKEAYVARDGGLTVRVVYMGDDGMVHFEYCTTEQQADDFLEAEKARMRRRASNE